MELMEFKQKVTDKFNAKWANKELYFCPSIFNEMNLTWTLVRACCSCTMVPFTPPVFYIAENNNYDALHLVEYFRQLNRIMTWNQTKEKSVCAGCNFFRKMIVPPPTL